jgi:hypothetical protein
LKSFPAGGTDSLLKELSPQAIIEPSDLRAREWAPPAETEVNRLPTKSQLSKTKAPQFLIEAAKRGEDIVKSKKQTVKRQKNTRGPR